MFPGASSKRWARYSNWWQDECSDAIQQSLHGIGMLAGDIKGAQTGVFFSRKYK